MAIYYNVIPTGFRNEPINEILPYYRPYGTYPRVIKCCKLLFFIFLYLAICSNQLQMANTFSQLNIHVVFTILGKENLLLKSFRYDLFRYISGILNNLGQFSLAVNGYHDHVHIFFELKPSQCLSDIVREVKANSSKWINNKLVKGKFACQEG